MLQNMKPLPFPKYFIVETHVRIYKHQKNMNEKKFIVVTDPNGFIGQITTEVQNFLQTELNVQRKPEKQNSVEYLTRKDVVEKLHCSYSTIHRMINNGGLRCYKFGRKSLFRSTDVETALVQLNTKGGNYAY